MARIGLTNIWFSVLTEASDGTATYEGATQLGKAVSTDFAPTTSDAKLYGDDALAESDSAATGGTLTLGITEDDDTVFAPLLGHEIDDETNEVVYTADDAAPYVGVGYILSKMVNGARKYKVDFFYKAKFKDMQVSQQTKGEQIEFTTPTVEGNISVLADGKGTWRKSKTFTALSDALTYLKNLMAAVGTTYRVTYDLMGGTSSTIEDESVEAGESVILDDGTGITAPSGKVFSKWALDPEGTITAVSPYTPSEDVTLYAIYVNEE